MRSRFKIRLATIAQSLGALMSQGLRTSPPINSLFTISDDTTTPVRDRGCVAGKESLLSSRKPNLRRIDETSDTASIVVGRRRASLQPRSEIAEKSARDGHREHVGENVPWCVQDGTYRLRGRWPPGWTRPRPWAPSPCRPPRAPGSCTYRGPGQHGANGNQLVQGICARVAPQEGGSTEIFVDLTHLRSSSSSRSARSSSLNHRLALRGKGGRV